MIQRVRTDRDGSKRVRMLGTPDFVGRDDSLAALRRVLAGPGAVVLVEGEAGIGKTRLIREYLATGPGGKAGTLVASCPPFRQPQTLGPVADAVRQAVGEVRGLGLSGLAGALRPLFPEWAADLPPEPEPAEDATAARYRLFAALAEAIDCLGVRLLVLEDAHWADEATVEFLLFLASRPAGPVRPVSLVITSRPEDVPPGSLLPRLSRLAAGTSGQRITLGALSVDDTAQMVSSMLTGGQMSAEFAGFLHEHTGGVPLVVEESVRLMAVRADLRRRGGQWVRRELAELSVPPPVRDAVLERAAQLPPDTQAVLRAAAVLGEPAADATLSAVTGFSAERLRAGLSETLACGLLAEDHRGLVSFRHALACRAVYESVPGPQRRLLHERAGQALHALSPGSLAALARHFREAGDTQAWLRHGEQAADRALATGDETNAAVLLHDLVTRAGLPAGTVVRLAGKMVLLALPGEERLASLADALRAVLNTGVLTPSVEARLRFQLGRTLATMQEYEASRAELEQAVAGLPPDSLHAVRAMMLLGGSEGSDRPVAEHLHWLRRAGAAEASMPPGERLRLLVDRATALLILGEEEGWAEAARIPWDAATPRDRLQVLRAQGNLGDVAMTWGRHAEARRRLERALTLTCAYHYERLRGWSVVELAHLDWLTGAWAGLAERAAALAADDDLQALTKLVAMQVAALLRAVTGGSDQALQDLALVAEDLGRRYATEYMTESAAVLARLHLAKGGVTQALEITGTALDVVRRREIWLWAADLAPARVAALTAASQMAEATALTEAFATGLGGRDIPAAGAGLMMCRAVLAEAAGPPARASVLFGRAAAAWQALPRPYDALLASERQAHCLLAAGEDETGLRILTETSDGLCALGAASDCGRVAAALRDLGAGCGARRGRGRPSYGDTLSPRELEIVRLVAQGSTNRQIAGTLVLSRQTVESHVHSAMRKLRVSSRTVLAVRAAEQGLLPGPRAENNHEPSAPDLNP